MKSKWIRTVALLALLLMVVAGAVGCGGTFARSKKWGASGQASQ